MKKLLILILLLILFIAIYLTGYFQKEATPQVNTWTKPVAVLEAKTLSHQLPYQAFGVISGHQTTTYASKLGGKLSKISINVGDEVHSNTHLFSLDTEDLARKVASAQLAATQASVNLSKAKAAFELVSKRNSNMEQLYAQNAISEDQYDEMLTSHTLAKADLTSAALACDTTSLQLESLQDNLEDASVFSINNGTVSAVLKDSEDYVQPGEPIVIVRSNSMVVKTSVTSDFLPFVHIGDTCSITYQEEHFEGTITSIQLDPVDSTMLYPVEIAINGSEFISGDFVNVNFFYKEAIGIEVPINSVMLDTAPYVFIVEEGKACKAYVNIIDSNEGSLIISGLKEGANVVTQGMKNLKNDDLVQIASDPLTLAGGR